MSSNTRMHEGAFRAQTSERVALALIDVAPDSTMVESETCLDSDNFSHKNAEKHAQRTQLRDYILFRSPFCWLSLDTPTSCHFDLS